MLLPRTEEGLGSGFGRRFDKNRAGEEHELHTAGGVCAEFWRVAAVCVLAHR